MIKNRITKAFSEKKGLFQEFEKGVNDFFTSNLTLSLYKDDNVELKYYKNDDFVYVLEKRENKISVYRQEIENKKTKDVKKIIDLDYLKQNLKLNKELFLYKIFSARKFDEFKKFIEQKNIIELTKLFAEVGEDTFISDDKTNPLFYSICSEPKDIYNLSKILSDNNFMNNYGKEFYSSLNKYNIEYYQDKIEHYAIHIEAAKHFCLEKKHTVDNEYDYNDLDNSFFVKEKMLCIKDQNHYFIVDFKDRDNYEVFCVSKDCASKKDFNRLWKNYKENMLDDEHCVLKVVSGKIENLSPSGLYVLDLDLEFGVNSLVEDGCIVNYPVDIYDYDYQKKYFAYMTGKNETEFLSHCFLTLGNGYKKDEKGRIFYRGTKYIKNIQEINNTEEKLKQIYPVNDYEKLNGLNEAWQDGLKKLIAKIENDKPIIMGDKEFNQDKLNRILESLNGVLENSQNKFSL